MLINIVILVHRGDLAEGSPVNSVLRTESPALAWLYRDLCSVVHAIRIPYCDYLAGQPNCSSLWLYLFGLGEAGCPWAMRILMTGTPIER